MTLLTAHHEAAHAVVQYRTTGVADSITVIPEGDMLGGAKDSGHIDSTIPEHIEARILSTYAGGHAQRRCDPLAGDDGCDSDDEHAVDLLQQWNWADREQELRDRARDLVERHWTEIVAVATELVHAGTLDSEEVEMIADAAAGITNTDLANDLAAWRALKNG